MVYSIASMVLLVFIALLALCGTRAHFWNKADDASVDTASNTDTTSSTDTNNDASKNLEINGLLSAQEGAKSSDDLKRIKGVGPKLEALLHSLGIYTFAQVSKWSDEDVLQVDNQLKFSGRIVRDEWVAQAKVFLEKTAS